MCRLVWTIALLLALTGCQESREPDLEAVRAAIDEQLQQGVTATREQDIDLYMEGLPEGLAIYDESGEVISREQQRANILRDWAIIPRTLDLVVTLDSLEVSGDSVATVYTSQRWERMMLRRDDSGQDTVVTTQRHRETWRPTPDGWRLFTVVELGGRIWINGEPYTP